MTKEKGPITKICDRWLEKPNGYLNFKEDMGERPEGMTLEEQTLTVIMNQVIVDGQQQVNRIVIKDLLSGVIREERVLIIKRIYNNS